mgnify:CR=1 FL=1
MIYVFLGLILADLIVNVVLLLSQKNNDGLSNAKKEITDEVKSSIKLFSDVLSSSQEQFTKMQDSRMQALTTQMSDNMKLNEQKLENVRKTVEDSLKNIQEDNSKKLEQMRQTVDENKWYDVKIVVTPYAVTLYVDGEETVVGKPAVTTRHFCQTGYDEPTGELIIKVVNATEQAYKRSFAIEGAMNVLPTGKVITLSGAATDENTFEQPTKLAPVTELYGKFDKKFEYEFKPMSFTILRIKVAK